MLQRVESVTLAQHSDKYRSAKFRFVLHGIYATFKTLAESISFCDIGNSLDKTKAVDEISKAFLMNIVYFV